MRKFYKAKYDDDNNLAIIAIDDDGEFYGTLTVNINPLKYGLACIDINNYPNSETVAKELGGRFTGSYMQSGYCTYPIYDFTDVIENLEDIED